MSQLKGFFRALYPWLGALLFLGVFFFNPLVRILALSLDGSVFSATQAAYTFSVLRFTFFQAFLSTLLTLALGLPAAFLFARFNFRGGQFLRILTAIPFMLPTVVVAAGFNAWLGPRGWLNILLMKSFGLELPPIHLLGTLGAILLAHVFYNTTIVIRLAGNALSRLDPRLDQAARSLGADARQVFWKVTLPLLRGPLLAAALLVFLFDFTSFGVILMLGGPQFATLEVEIYYQALTFFNLPLAAWLSLIQLACTLVFSIIYSRLVRRTQVTVAPRPNPSVRPHTAGQRVFVALLALFLLLFYFLPLFSVPLRSLTRLEPDLAQRGEVQYGLTTDFYSELFVNRQGSVFYVPPVDALVNSLGYAFVTVLVCLALGFPVAVALRRPGRVERLLDPLLMLPLGASAVTLGLGFIVTFNKPLFGSDFVLLSSQVLVPIAHSLIALPFVIRSLQPALASIPESLHQAAASLGSTPRRIRREVDWPLVRRAVLSSAAFAFTISLGEFGATSLVYRPDHPTLPVAIFRFLAQPGALNYGQAMAMATILMLIAGSGILLIERSRTPGAGDF
jgi:thiamine transport system permease protein